MDVFAPEFIAPLPGTLSGEPNDVRITIPLRPFVLDGQPVSTTIHLDTFSFPVTAFAELAACHFTFPVNPEPGFIDGSVYIRHVHNPVDVTVIRFGKLSGDTIL